MQLYLPHILSQVQEKGLPAELTLLPVVGTALDPYACSPSSASELWQFMRPTAKQYSLRINNGYDGRQDVIDATDAALTYLQDLHKCFDDWQLALAAYNAGGGTVAKAIRESLHRDFFVCGCLAKPKLMLLDSWHFQPLLPNLILSESNFLEYTITVHCAL